jgi:hypothetical protein
MSNLIYNGDFSLPNITTNTTVRIVGLTAIQKQQLFWYTGSESPSPTTYLIDGSGGGFPSPSLVSASQFIGFYTSSFIGFARGYLNQDITIFNTGTYTLSFQYSRRTGYTFSNIQIYFGNTLFDTVTTVPAANTWATYSNTYNCTNAGTTTLQLRIANTTGTFASGVANVSLTPLLLNTDLSYNNLKNTNIFGSLNVDDTVINGNTISGSIQTPQLLVGGTDLSTELSTGVINFNYSTIPSYVSTNLGRIYSSGTPVASITSIDIANPTEIVSIPSLPVGVYFISYTLTTYFGSTVGPTLRSVVTQNDTTSRIWSVFFNYFHTTNYYYHASSAFTYNITSTSSLYLVGWMTSSSATVGWAQIEAMRIA